MPSGLDCEVGERERERQEKNQIISEGLDWLLQKISRNAAAAAAAAAAVATVALVSCVHGRFFFFQLSGPNDGLCAAELSLPRLPCVCLSGLSAPSLSLSPSSVQRPPAHSLTHSHACLLLLSPSSSSGAVDVRRRTTQMRQRGGRD